MVRYQRDRSGSGFGWIVSVAPFGLFVVLMALSLFPRWFRIPEEQRPQEILASTLTIGGTIAVFTIGTLIWTWPAVRRNRALRARLPDAQIFYVPRTPQLEKELRRFTQGGRTVPYSLTLVLGPEGMALYAGGADPDLLMSLAPEEVSSFSVGVDEAVPNHRVAALVFETTDRGSRFVFAFALRRSGQISWFRNEFALAPLRDETVALWESA